MFYMTYTWCSRWLWVCSRFCVKAAKHMKVLWISYTLDAQFELLNQLVQETNVTYKKVFSAAPAFHWDITDALNED